MKLSQMTNDHFRNVLATAAVELEPILKDKRIATISLEFKPKKDELNIDYGIRIASLMIQTIGHVNKEYVDGIYRLFAAFFQCSPEGFGKMTLADTMAQIKDSLSDEIFVSFFPSLKPSGVTESLDTSQTVETSPEVKRGWFTSLKNIGKSNRR